MKYPFYVAVEIIIVEYGMKLIDTATVDSSQYFIVIDDFESIPFRFMNNRYQQCANLIGQKTDY